MSSARDGAASAKERNIANPKSGAHNKENRPGLSDFRKTIVFGMGILSL
jgi:hypothetical protein